MYEFGVRFKALMDRYQQVLRFSMYGHIHSEDFVVWSNEATDTPINVGMIQRPVTTYGSRDPAFYVMEWDEEYMVPINVWAHKLNLESSNANPDEPPTFSLDYDYRELNEMEDMSPSSYKKLANKLYEDNGKDLYYKCATAVEHYEKWRCVFGEGNDLYHIIAAFIGFEFSGKIFLVFTHMTNWVFETVAGPWNEQI
jgi:hypothetical protein